MFSWFGFTSTTSNNNSNNNTAQSKSTIAPSSRETSEDLTNSNPMSEDVTAVEQEKALIVSAFTFVQKGAKRHDFSVDKLRLRELKANFKNGSPFVQVVEIDNLFDFLKEEFFDVKIDEVSNEMHLMILRVDAMMNKITKDYWTKNEPALKPKMAKFCTALKRIPDDGDFKQKIVNAFNTVQPLTGPDVMGFFAIMFGAVFAIDHARRLTSSIHADNLLVVDFAMAHYIKVFLSRADYPDNFRLYKAITQDTNPVDKSFSFSLDFPRQGKFVEDVQGHCDDFLLLTGREFPMPTRFHGKSSIIRQRQDDAANAQPTPANTAVIKSQLLQHHAHFFDDDCFLCKSFLQPSQNSSPTHSAAACKHFRMVPYFDPSGPITFIVGKDISVRQLKQDVADGYKIVNGKVMGFTFG